MIQITFFLSPGWMSTYYRIHIKLGKWFTLKEFLFVRSLDQKVRDPEGSFTKMTIKPEELPTFIVIAAHRPEFICVDWEYIDSLRKKYGQYEEIEFQGRAFLPRRKDLKKFPSYGKILCVPNWDSITPVEPVSK